MRNKIGLLKLNSIISMQLSRKGKVVTVKVKILEPKISKKSDIKINTRLEGIIFSEIKEGMQEYGEIIGIKIIKMKKDSRAYLAGIRPNDIILSINNIPVQKIKDLEIVSGKNDSELVMHVQRNNRTAFILLK
jgi:S1-C subfamily serine protease